VSWDEEGIYQAIRSGAARAIIDPKWNYKPEVRDLLKYHRYGGVDHPMDDRISKAVPKYS
jgi:hypothetical protein